MGDNQLRQIESWFAQLNQRVGDSLEKQDQKIENRFTALLTVCTNTRKDVAELKEDVKSQRKDIEEIKMETSGLKTSHEEFRADLDSIKRCFDDLKEELKLLPEAREFEARMSVIECAIKELERRLSH